jgi:hypothetical protein
MKGRNVMVQTAQHSNVAQHPASAASLPPMKRSITVNDQEVEVELPRRYTSPSQMTDALMLRFDRHCAFSFLAPFAKKCVADKKVPTPEEVSAAWLAWDIGKAREVGTGSTIRERAAALVADALLPAGKTYAKGQKGAMTERIVAAIDDGSASERTTALFNDALAKLRKEAEAKRGTKTTKESVASDSIEV